MTQKDLKDYKYNQIWIKGRLDYIEEYKTNITNMTVIISDMPKGSKKVDDIMAEKITELIKTTDELLEIIIEEDQKQKLILKQLDKIEQPYKLILEKAYIQGKSLVTIAEELNYSYRDICRKNSIALKKFDDIHNVLLCH